MATKKFDPADFEAFPEEACCRKRSNGFAIRHAVEVRHDSFKDKAFVELCRKHGVAIVFGADSEFPLIGDVTADFIYARIMGTEAKEKLGYPPAILKKWAERARDWEKGASPKPAMLVAPPAPSKKRDVFLFVISGAKERTPAAARSSSPRFSRNRAMRRGAWTNLASGPNIARGTWGVRHATDRDAGFALCAARGGVAEGSRPAVRSRPGLGVSPFRQVFRHQPGGQGAQLYHRQRGGADGFGSDPGAYRPCRAAQPDAADRAAHEIALRQVGLALATCEKTVSIIYERNQRPAEKQHQPWLDRVRGQLLHAYGALEKEASPDWFTGEELMQPQITCAVAWRYPAQCARTGSRVRFSATVRAVGAGGKACPFQGGFS